MQQCDAEGVENASPYGVKPAYCDTPRRWSTSVGTGSASRLTRISMAPYCISRPTVPQFQFVNTGLASAPSASGARFAHPLSSKQLENACSKYIPTNTRKNNAWACKVFDEWLVQRNGQVTSDKEKMPDVLRTVQAVPTIDHVLAAFVIESRRKDGNYYPPNSLKNILSALFRVMKDTFGAGSIVTFMENKTQEKDYPKLHNAMDRHFRMLREKGVGVERKQAEFISPEDERVMWEKGVLGTDTPRALLQTVFFYNGKSFCLRGQQEHQTLRMSQLVRAKDPDRYVYLEFGSKNHSGGVLDKQFSGKKVTIVDSGEKFSHVALLDLYISKRPEMPGHPDPPFYLAPYPYTPLRGHWYFPERLSTKTLNSLIKTMASEAGLSGNYTNHSLRVTGTTSLFDAGVPEAIIQKRTGHKSVDALRCYERVTLSQDMQVSAILNPSIGHGDWLSMTEDELAEFESKD